MTTMTETRPDVAPVLTRHADARHKVSTRNVNLFYGEKQALFGIDLDIPANQVTALIGPSGCGKSTYLRCINRMNDTIPIARFSGSIELDGMDIYDPRIDVVELRARVGMVFQKPNPFPKSIFENVAYGPKIYGMARSRADLEAHRHQLAEAGRPLERGQGPAERAGHRPLRRPAAAALHRPRHRHPPRGAPHGRASLGARPDRHRHHRGVDRRAACQLHHRHRHPLDAAGGARQPAHRLLPPRQADRARRPPIRVSRTRSRSRPRTISPASSAEPATPAGTAAARAC